MMNNLMKFVSPRWILAAVSTLVLVCLIGGSLRKVNAASVCTVGSISESSLNGPYGWAFTALVPVSASANTLNEYQPGALAGTWTFDGAGKFTGIETLCISGQCLEDRPIFDGTYTVGSDGRGTATFTDFRVHTRDFVIVSQCNEVDFVETSEGIVGTGAMKKQ
jgi:hypothetical protein